MNRDTELQQYKDTLQKYDIILLKKSSDIELLKIKLLQ